MIEKSLAIPEIKKQLFRLPMQEMVEKEVIYFSNISATFSTMCADNLKGLNFKEILILLGVIF